MYAAGQGCRPDRIFHQHGYGHGAHAARHRGNGAGNLACSLKVNIAF
jgi:hypothetical protein